MAPVTVAGMAGIGGLLVTLLLVGIGLSLALGGFLFFRGALYLLGFLLGLSVGLIVLVNGTAPEGWGIAALVVGPVIGVSLALVVRFLLVATIGGLGGAVAVSVLASEPLVPSSGLPDPLLLAGVVVGVVVAFFLETAIIVLVTASWGSSMVALAVAAGASTVTTDPEVLLGGMGAVRILVFVLGLAAQSGLWYWLRRNKPDDMTAGQFLLRQAGAASAGGDPRETERHRR